MNDFIAQTARDFNMEYRDVETIFILYPPEIRWFVFYEKLEEFIAIRKQQDKGD